MTVSKTDYNRLGCAVLLKSFQIQGKFPQRKQDIPTIIIEYIAQQLTIVSSVFQQYAWAGRTIEKHRSQIRKFLGVRIGTVADANAVFHWLETQNQLPDFSES